MVMQSSTPCAPPEQTRPRATLAPFLPKHRTVNADQVSSIRVKVVRPERFELPIN
jgi:hypothetical protein